MDVQAKALLKSFLCLSSRHRMKVQQNIRGSRTTGKIHSLATYNKYSTALKLAGEWTQEHLNIRHLRELNSTIAQQYLGYRAEKGIGQKQLDADRNALEFILGKGVLQRQKSGKEPNQSSRIYTAEQITLICQGQNSKNALATQIAYHAGLRAHELLTLQPIREASASNHRHWRNDRFERREGERYIVIGKGGLRREVMIPMAIVKSLEVQRLGQPCIVKDRGIEYEQYYDMGGGNRWSKSFSAASTRILGWSKGAHGLRHCYAQERMQELQTLGKRYFDARDVVSQELGHFRGDIVETYLR